MTGVKANYATSQQVNESITDLVNPPYKTTLDSVWRVAWLYSSSARLQLAKVLTAGDLKKPEHKGVIPGKVFCAPFASDLALRARRKITCSDKIRVYGEAIAR